MSIDLHLHSHHSDGTWAPSDLVEHAVKLKMKVIALTDHDTTNGVQEALDAAAGRVEVIPGIEINTIWNDGDGNVQDVHILGYYIDVDNEHLKEVLKRQRQARVDHLEECIKLIAGAGVPLTREKVQEFAGAGAIGKAHITKAIVNVGGAVDIHEAYERFMVRGSPYYAQRRSVNPFEAVAAIVQSGGVASIAHPGKGEKIRSLILELKEHGMQSVEAYHRVHSGDTVRSYLRFAHRNGLIVTGGSDCHGPYEGYQSTMGSISIPKEVVRNLNKTVA